MTTWLITFGWLWFVLGTLSGALLGLGFHRPDFWGGYDSWRRRLARLGHISFFGTGGLALAMGLTAAALELTPDNVTPPGALLVVGALSMPTVCFLAAWRKPWRRLFVLPVVTLSGGVLWFTALLLVETFQTMKGG